MQRIAYSVFRIALVALFVLTLWLSNAAPALAHAKLIKSSPVAGSILDASPQEIRLYLSEAVSLDFSTISILDRSRTDQQVGHFTRGDTDADVRATIPEPLPPGTYTVIWRVLSAVDGHVTAGTLAFRVRGTGTPGPDEGEVVPITGSGDEAGPLEGSSETPDPLRWLVRAIILAAAALLVGGALFTVGVIEPSAREQGQAGAALMPIASRRFGFLGSIAACVLFICLIYDLLAQVAAITATNLLDALSRGSVAQTLLASTRYGFSWTLKAIAALALLGVMLFVWRLRKGEDARLGPSPWDLTVGLGSLFLLAEALSSHAAAADTSQLGGITLGLPVPVISNWLHLATASLWLGGLAYMTFVLFPAFRATNLKPEARRALLARTVPRFTRFAILSVVLLALTGTYNLVVHSTQPGAILGSTYGQVLAVKIAIFAILVAIGALNWRRLTPLLMGQGSGVRGQESEVGDRGTGARRRKPVETEETQSLKLKTQNLLQRNVRTEVALAVVVLLCAGGLTLLPPPSNSADAYTSAIPAATGTPPAVAPTPGPASASTFLAGYDFTFTARPSIEGDELNLQVNRTADAAPPLTDVIKVLFKVTPQDVDAGSTSYEATIQGEAGPTRLEASATEPILTLDGIYLVTAIVQRTESTDLKVAFTLNLTENYLTAGPSQVVEVRLSTDPSPPISGTAILKLRLVDGEGKPVEGAKITTSPFMPAHAHVEPDAIAQPVPGEPGSYTMPVNFIMTGPWLLIFRIEREGFPPIKTDASIDVLEDPNNPSPTATPTPDAQSLSHALTARTIISPPNQNAWESHPTILVILSAAKNLVPRVDAWGRAETRQQGQERTRGTRFFAALRMTKVSGFANLHLTVISKNQPQAAQAGFAMRSPQIYLPGVPAITYDTGFH
ncbi:MAG TPA: copper resistance protein CopC [Chloroflexia bacterium]|jgi:copper transport protein